MAGLVFLVETVTGGADPEFAGWEGDPEAFADHTGPGAVDELPGHGAAGRDKRGHRAIGGHFYAAGWGGAEGRVGHGRIVQELGQHPPARPGLVAAKVQAA